MERRISKWTFEKRIHDTVVYFYLPSLDWYISIPEFTWIFLRSKQRVHSFEYNIDDNSMLTIRLHDEVIWRFEWDPRPLPNYTVHITRGWILKVHRDNKNHLWTFVIERRIEHWTVLLTEHYLKVFSVGGFVLTGNLGNRTLGSRILECGFKNIFAPDPKPQLLFRSFDLTLNNEDQIEELMVMTADHMRITSPFIRFTIPNRHFQAIDLELYDVNWISYANILNSEACRTVRISFGSWRIQAFLNEWARSGNTKLQYLRISTRRLKKRNTRFTGLPRREFNPNTLMDRLGVKKVLITVDPVELEVTAQERTHDINGNKATIHVSSSGRETIIHVFFWDRNEFYPYYTGDLEYRDMDDEDFLTTIESIALPPEPPRPIRFKVDSFKWELNDYYSELTIHLDPRMRPYKFIFSGSIPKFGRIHVHFGNERYKAIYNQNARTYHIKDPFFHGIRSASIHFLSLFQCESYSISISQDNFMTFDDLLNDLKRNSYCKSVNITELPYNSDIINKIWNFEADEMLIKMDGKGKPMTLAPQKFNAGILELTGANWIHPDQILTSTTCRIVRLNKMDTFDLIGFLTRWREHPNRTKQLEFLRVFYNKSKGLKERFERGPYTGRRFEKDSLKERKLDVYRKDGDCQLSHMGQMAFEVTREVDGYKATIHCHERFSGSTIHVFFWGPHEYYPYY